MQTITEVPVGCTTDLLDPFREALERLDCKPRGGPEQIRARCHWHRQRRKHDRPFAVGIKGDMIVFRCFDPRCPVNVDKAIVLRDVGGALGCDLDWPDLYAGGGQAPQLDDDDLEAQGIRPVPAGIIDRLPDNATVAERQVAADMERRKGRRMAQGEPRDRPYVYPMCARAKALAMSASTVQAAIYRLCATQVIGLADEIPIGAASRSGRRRRQAFAYVPGDISPPATLRSRDADRTRRKAARMADPASLRPLPNNRRSLRGKDTEGIKETFIPRTPSQERKGYSVEGNRGVLAGPTPTCDKHWRTYRQWRLHGGGHWVCECCHPPTKPGDVEFAQWKDDGDGQPNLIALEVPF